MENDRYVSLKDACEELHIGLVTGRRLFEELGALSKLGPRLIRINMSKVYCALNSQESSKKNVVNQ